MSANFRNGFVNNYGTDGNEYYQDGVFGAYGDAEQAGLAGVPEDASNWGYEAPLDMSTLHPDQQYGWQNPGQQNPQQFVNGDVALHNFNQPFAPPGGNQHNVFEQPFPYDYNDVAQKPFYGSQGQPGQIFSHIGRPQEAAQYVQPQDSVPSQTITPNALQRGQSQSKPSPSPEVAPIQHEPDEKILFQPLPPGRPQGQNFVVTQVDELEKVVKARRLCAFVHVATVPKVSPVPKTVVDKKRSKKAVKDATKASAPQPAELAVKRVVDASKQAASPAATGSPSDSSSSDGEAEESMRPPIPATRPDNALAGVKYDTIKILWRVPYRSVAAEDIRAGMQAFWELIQTIRDRWRSDVAAVKQAEDANKISEVPLLKDRVATQRTMLEAILRSAVLEGHKDFFDHFRQHLQLMGVVAIFLRDRASESDYNSKFTKSLLDFISRCRSMTKGDLERAQIGKLLIRFSKRGDDTVKTLCKRITDNANTALGKKRDGPETVVSAAPNPAVKSKEANAGPLATGVKRAREGDGESKPLAKKVASEKPAAKPLATTSKPEVKKPADGKAATTSAQPTMKKVVAKPSAIFSSLQPAYKKPTPAAPTPAPAKVVKRYVQNVMSALTCSEAPKKAAPSASTASQSAFSMVFDTLVKPKEPEAKPEKEESSVPETADEKKRRLRRERRGNLRVSFKPEADLVQVRLFTHDPDEELGHDASQIRDVGDLESEGRMFKLQHKHDESAMDIDDDEEFEPEEPIIDLSTKPYTTPSAIDFSELPEDSLTSNYSRGGGALQPESPEREAQEQREANTLMAVYAQPSDIPATPREPIEAADEAVELKEFGKPEGTTLPRLARLEEQKRAAPPVPDLTALLGAVSSLSQPARQQPPPPPMNAQNLEQILRLAQGPQLAQKPPAWPAQFPFGQHHPPPPPPPGAAGAPAPTPDISSLLASLQQSGAFAALSKMEPPAQAPPQPLPKPDRPYENEERRRWREAQEQQEHGPAQGAPKPGPAQGPPQYSKETGLPMYVHPCRFFFEGKCTKGAACTYRHDMEGS